MLQFIQIKKENVSVKKIQAFLLTIICCFVSLFSTGCNLFVDFDYNIDFVVDGEVVATVGTNGDKIAMPKNPVKSSFPHFLHRLLGAVGQKQYF